MNTRYTIITTSAIILAVIQLIMFGVGNWRFEKDYLQYWNLADKSSTLEAKQKFIQSFISALESGLNKGYFSAHNALVFKTPNNEFRANLNAVKTLSRRLDEIKDMDPNSFQYNTAIQQITAQEQGEAQQLISVFRGCYFLYNYFICWDWVGALFAILMWGLVSGVFLYLFVVYIN